MRRYILHSSISLAFLLLLTLPAVVQAQFNYFTNNGTITITGYTGSGGDVTIPDRTNGYPVTSIADMAFLGCHLTRVTIGTNVTSIGDQAFMCCTSLTNVTIPDSLTSIGWASFDGCSRLTNVTIPSSVSSVGNEAFESCSSLSAITVDTNNPAYSSIAGVLFNKSQTTLIEYPGGTAGGYIVPNSVTSIGPFAFADCRLTNVTILASVTNIEISAFALCASLTSITIPNSITSIGAGAFEDCGSLARVTIPNTVTSIGENAFSGCGGLTSVTIPNGVTSIGYEAFEGCTRLTGVYFNGNAPSADSTVFLYATHVTVYYLPGTEGWGSSFEGRPTALWNGFIPISPTLSTLGATPGTVLADGQSTITVTATVRDANANPVPGKTVTIFYSGGSLNVSQPVNPTDANGTATGTITASAPVTASIWAIDTTDVTVIQQQQTIQFTSAFVLPDPTLSTAIAQLGNSTDTLLTQSIAAYAIREGKIGDYFQDNIALDKRANGVTSLSAGIGGIVTLLAPEMSLLYEVALSLDQDLGSADLSDCLNAIARSNTGLTTYGEKIASDNNQLEKSAFNAQQNVLKDVMPVANTYISEYTIDIAARMLANKELTDIILSQQNLLVDLQANAEVSHIDLLGAIFMPINVVGAVGGTLIAGPVGGKAASIGLNLSEALANYGANQANLTVDQNTVNSADISLINCSHISHLIYANTAAAFGTILQGKQPTTITGTIVDVQSAQTYKPLSGIVGDLTGWAGMALEDVTYVKVTGAHSTVTVLNTSQQSASFNIYALYWHTISINDQLGDALESQTIPMVVAMTTTIDKGKSSEVTLNYFDGANGAAPDIGSSIMIYVLGSDSQEGIYAVDSKPSTIEWQLDMSGGPTPMGNGPDTNSFAFENPIKTYVSQVSSDQTYLARIVVGNPFTVPLLATVTQPLLSGIRVLNTDGMLHSSTIVWTNAIATNAFVEHTFMFDLSTTPGAPTNITPATLVFSDGTGTNSLSVQSFLACFDGEFPVQVSGVVPKGVFGVDALMALTVTNLTGSNQRGSLTITLTDAMGNIISNLVQTFAVNGLFGTNLNVTLPRTLSPGSYLVSGSLTINGGSGQAFSGVYTVPQVQITISLGSNVPLTTKGLSLIVRGPTSSNLLIEASSDICTTANWKPVAYFTLTNSVVTFIDTAATNYGRRFYRALIP